MIMEKDQELEVDVSTLHVGLVVNNYKEMCRLLDQQPTTGNAKKAQIDQWGRYFNWVRSKNRFIITEIYDIPLPEETRGDAVFSKYIEKQLTLALAQNPDGVFCFTDNVIFEALNMVGSEYRQLRSYETTVKELQRADNEISWYGMWLLRAQAKAKLRRILDNALESMRRRGVISYKREDAVAHSKNGDYESATDEETKLILEARQYALKKFGYEFMPAVINSKEATAFYDCVNQYLYDNYHIYETFPWIKIVFRRPYYMDEVIEKVKEQYRQMALEYYDSRRMLNESVVKSFYKMLKNSNKRSTNIMGEIGEDGWPKKISEPEDKDSMKSSLQYLFDGEKFIERYIRSESEKNGGDWIFKLDLSKF